MRNLASVVEITDIQPIPGADNIMVATVKGWKVVVKKNEFKVGDKAIYFEIDSFLPVKEQYEFLRKSSFRTMADGHSGFRLKTIKLRGQVSQGLLLPLNFEAEIGEDVTERLGVTKYEPPIPAVLSGDALGLFPGFLRRTDEERVQNYLSTCNLSGQNLHVTEKLDGSSATFFLKDGEFGVCSRNLRLKESANNAFWLAARQMQIEEKLRSLNANWAIQGELLGPGIQGNAHKQNSYKVHFFNMFDIDNQVYIDYVHMKRLLGDYPLVPDLGIYRVPEYNPNNNDEVTHTVDEILQFADGKSALADTMREGVVFRSSNKEISFKAISNNWLLRYEN